MKAVRYVPKDCVRVTLVVPETDEVVVVEADGFETKDPFAISRLNANPHVERAAAPKKSASAPEGDGEGAKTTNPDQEDETP